MIVLHLFTSDGVNDILDEKCPICLESLQTHVENACCDGYAKKLKCGHYAHVFCQINRNPDMIRCCICRKELVSFDIYYKICHAMLLKKVPMPYHQEFANGIPSQQRIDTIGQKDRIDFQPLKNGFDVLDKVRSDEKMLKKIFVQFWIHQKNL